MNTNTLQLRIFDDWKLARFQRKHNQIFGKGVLGTFLHIWGECWEKELFFKKSFNLVPFPRTYPICCIKNDFFGGISITWKRKLRILLKISIGLKSIHGRNFVHRDLRRMADFTLNNNEIIPRPTLPSIRNLKSISLISTMKR
ncbi:hypothetical protein RCL_jg24700.t1 [Rhizophagus clarus]|uniref:Protein kinase domain-containing protein n=1 Tax=Rhizophagus clarus TaxID=94130 RepID=A0A8H3M0B9_9GLOM|nr:hypothetical protein RCL_jg24700.t1 [Rhizophagus clarus]